MAEPGAGFWKKRIGRFRRGVMDLRPAGGAGAGVEAGGGEARGSNLRFVTDEGTSMSIAGETAKSDLTPKQRRRAQVRKAQLEHRQRKENHIKYLEQEVIELREKTAQAETQVVIFKHESIAIIKKLQNSHIPLSTSIVSSPELTTYRHPSQSQSLAQNQGQVLNTDLDTDLPMNLGSNPDEIFNPLSTTSLSWLRNTALVRTTFDPFLNNGCLQISPDGSFPLTVDSTTSVGNTDMYINARPENDTNSNDISPSSLDMWSWEQAVLAQQERENMQKRRQEIHGGREGGREGGSDKPSRTETEKAAVEEEMEMLAINFILALEHPCRTHFSPPSTAPFDPISEATGHELMATTHLFSHPPSSTPVNRNPLPSTRPAATNQSTNTEPSGHLDDTPYLSSPPSGKWHIPVPSLHSLHQMSEGMPKPDWEITPVQAWFLLVGRYGRERLLGVRRDGFEGWREGGGGETVLEGLKRGLGGLVSCLEFGSVLDEGRFWRAVGDVLGGGGGSVESGAV